MAADLSRARPALEPEPRRSSATSCSSRAVFLGFPVTCWSSDDLDRHRADRGRSRSKACRCRARTSTRRASRRSRSVPVPREGYIFRGILQAAGTSTTPTSSSRARSIPRRWSSREQAQQAVELLRGAVDSGSSSCRSPSPDVRADRAHPAALGDLARPELRQPARRADPPADPRDRPGRVRQFLCPGAGRARTRATSPISARPSTR